jgi:tRNA dimethylallyltransferase
LRDTGGLAPACATCVVALPAETPVFPMPRGFFPAEMPRRSDETPGVPGTGCEGAFFVVGPTATGKSEIAVMLAEQIGGEIVGADAFQVYTGLDVLGAKPTARLRALVPHHLIGEVPLTAHFDVAQWLARARDSIARIRSRGRVPVVCGGTGLYIRALTRGLAELPGADRGLRAELEAQPLPELIRRLRELDPATAVDPCNPRRVVRALEVCILTGRPFSGFRREWEGGTGLRGVIVSRPREELYGRIDARVAAMFEAGVIEEVAAAGEIGPTAGQMLGLREIRALLSGAITRPECIAAIQRATRNYARRQLTWFRKEAGFDWLEIGGGLDAADLLRRLMSLASAERPRN